jgi:hypothetical protein
MTPIYVDSHKAILLNSLVPQTYIGTWNCMSEQVSLANPFHFDEPASCTETLSPFGTSRSQSCVSPGRLPPTQKHGEILDRPYGAYQNRATRPAALHHLVRQ